MNIDLIVLIIMSQRLSTFTYIFTVQAYINIVTLYAYFILQTYLSSCIQTLVRQLHNATSFIISNHSTTYNSITVRSQAQNTICFHDLYQPKSIVNGITQAPSSITLLNLVLIWVGHTLKLQLQLKFNYWIANPHEYQT